jgi:hypothetical protein
LHTSAQDGVCFVDYDLPCSRFEAARNGLPFPRRELGLFIDSLTPGTSTFFAAHFLGHRFGLIPAPDSFAASAFPVPPEQHGSLPQSSRSLWEQKPLAFGCPKNMGRKKEIQKCHTSIQ